MKTIVSPSVLSMDFSRMAQQMQLLEQSGAPYIHFDVMDGHFVPNLTFGPDILKGFRKMTDLVLDVHLMVEDPVFYADVFLDAGADIITFHWEALKEEAKIRSLAQHIHERGRKAGLTIRPSTDLAVLKPFLKDFDMFLIMSVEPGFSGQKFMPESIDRIRTLRGWLDDAGRPDVRIEVDGGMNAETVKPVIAAGASVIVAGSYVFKQDIVTAVRSLC
jgi:ribulose-phosphate 3-epimerase